jgi:3-hydroxyisobutyrate dehydrogenase-like beta-hydroxyacid dehydrogenase
LTRIFFSIQSPSIELIALALAERLLFAKGTGIDTSTFVKILNSAYFKTEISERKGPRMVNHDYIASFYLTNIVNDDQRLNSTCTTLCHTEVADRLKSVKMVVGLHR